MTRRRSSTKTFVHEQSILIQQVRGDLTAAAKGEAPEPRLKDFPAFAFAFWGWEPSDLAGGPGGPELPASLEVPLADYGEVLAPRYAVPDPPNAGSWLMLIDVRADTAPLDQAQEENPHDKRWNSALLGRHAAPEICASDTTSRWGFETVTNYGTGTSPLFREEVFVVQ